MPSTGFQGVYSLTDEAIDKVVAKECIGAYALGKYDSTKDVFYVHYIGRSDTDVNDRLHQHADSNYTHFQFGYYSTMKAAFEKECRLYHDFSPPDNKRHPDQPNWTDYRCPVCGYPYLQVGQAPFPSG